MGSHTTIPGPIKLKMLSLKAIMLKVVVVIFLLRMAGADEVLYDPVNITVDVTVNREEIAKYLSLRSRRCLNKGEVG